MRTDFSTVEKLLRGFASRRDFSEGAIAPRELQPFASAREVSFAQLDDGSHVRRNLLETLVGRHSTLDYDDCCVETELILDLVQSALRRDSENWGLDGSLGALEGFVFAFKSSGLDRGVYRVTASEVAYLMPCPTDDKLDTLAIQKELTMGSGIVSVAAQLERADLWQGAHGYRITMVRAAAALYDFNVVMQSRGLVGTPFAGFIPSAVRNSLQSDGATRQQLFASTYAYPKTYLREKSEEACSGCARTCGRCFSRREV